MTDERSVFCARLLVFVVHMTDSEKKPLEGLLRRMEIKGISIDSRNIKEGELFIAIKGDRFDGHDFVPDAIKKGAWGALVERSALESRYDRLSGLKNIVPVEDTIFALQEMSYMHRKKYSIPVVGITGSNGKTTTKEMLAAILAHKGPVLKNEGNLNNHIGVPLTLLKLDARHRAAAVEMGMSATGEIDLLSRIVVPDVGVITNIGPAHLEFLGSLDRVAEAKAELLANVNPEGTAVLNADDQYFEALRKKFSGTVLSFGIQNKADVKAGSIGQGKDYTDFRLTIGDSAVNVRIRAMGTHNIYNALAAAAAAAAAGVSLDAVKTGLEDFLPVAMRSEIRIIRGRTVLTDCYNANPGSMKAALQTLITLRPGARCVAVLGDMLELGEAGAEQHREIGRTAARLGVNAIITLGPLSKHIIEGASEAGIPADSLFAATSHAEAAGLLAKQSRNGDLVLVKGSRGIKMEKILEEF
jgi:UDP-N-acetylmuramoyl-tripeptide--D-alanyl-D-alanine ligase